MSRGKAPKHEMAKRPLKRRRALTIAGALIVFLTFVVKEQIRDSLKDLKDSLAAADTLYTMEQDIRTVELHTFALEEQNSAAQIRQKVAATGNPVALQYPREIKTTIAMMKERDALLQSDFERVSKLAEKAFNKAALKDPLARMGDALSKFHEATEGKVKEIDSSPQDAATLGLAQLNLGYLLLAEVPVLDAGGAVLEALKKREEALETIYGWCGWLALFLYVFGWSLSLYGSLSGNGTLTVEK
jgi:hypothetical protein